MTLCLAWKQNNAIYLAADSRLTSGAGTPITNQATKIFKIGVQVFAPTPSDRRDEIPELVYKSTFGLAFAGSYINGSLLANTLDEVFSNLQAAPVFSEYSFDILSDIGLSIFEQVSQQMIEINRGGGIADVFLVGVCPNNGTCSLCKFTTQEDEITGIFNKHEKTMLNLDDDVYYIGDSNAIDAAKKLSKKTNSEYTYFHVLRDIIQNTDIKTVGGEIQAGVLKNSGFGTYGMVYYEGEEDKFGLIQTKHRFKFRGLDFNLDDTLRKGNLNIMQEFLNPFEADKQKIFQQSLDSIDRFNK